MVRLFQLAKRLRDPGGCPWDAEQTHHSLTRYLLEESYEVVEAVEALPIDAPAGGSTVPAEVYAALADELGDLLYQVVFHAVLARGGRRVHDGRRRPRHPRQARAPPPARVRRRRGRLDDRRRLRNWEQIKKEEKGTTSLVEGITPGLPSLLYTNKLFRKAASVGLDPGVARRGARPHRHRGRRVSARRRRDLEADLAQLLAAAVVVARAGGVDAESALRGWAARYRDRFEAMERLAVARDLDLAALDHAAVAALWLEAANAARAVESVAEFDPTRQLRVASGLQASVARSDGGDGAHAAGVEVVDRLDDLVAGVHHERAVVRDGLADREPAEQQHLERVGRSVLTVGGAHGDRVAGPEHHELVVRRPDGPRRPRSPGRAST